MTEGKDIGYEPLGGGQFQMFPSGDVVDWDEAKRRAPINEKPLDAGAFGLSWAQLERKQGGRLDR